MSGAKRHKAQCGTSRGRSRRRVLGVLDVVGVVGVVCGLPFFALCLLILRLCRFLSFALYGMFVLRTSLMFGHLASSPTSKPTEGQAPTRMRAPCRSNPHPRALVSVGAGGYFFVVATKKTSPCATTCGLLPQTNIATRLFLVRASGVAAELGAVSMARGSCPL